MPSRLPRVDSRDAHGLEMIHVSRDDRHRMDERRGGDEGIAIRARIRNVERRAALGHGGINREDATGERW